MVASHMKQKGSYGEWKGSWEKSEWDREKINKSIFV